MASYWTDSEHGLSPSHSYFCGHCGQCAREEHVGQWPTTYGHLCGDPCAEKWVTRVPVSAALKHFITSTLGKFPWDPVDLVLIRGCVSSPFAGYWHALERIRRSTSCLFPPHVFSTSSWGTKAKLVL